MTLGEIYTKGEQDLMSRELGFALGSVETGWVGANNRAVFDRWALRQKAINAPPSAETSVNFLGVDISAPVVMSAITMPIPGICEDGLLKVAQGLAEAGSVMWTGTPIPQDLQGLLATGVPLIASVKPYEDRDRLKADVEKITAEGVGMISLEIDAAMGTKIQDKPMATGCAPLSFAELQELRGLIKGKMIAKGVLSVPDAQLCVQAGVDAVVLSNHGAHTIDYLPHPLQVAQEVVAAIDGRAYIVMDGGFRRGTDVIKGLAMGADAIGLGRPILYALAAGEAQGVRDLIACLQEEMRRTMVMLGAQSPRDLGPECLIKL
ncbi:alpha-hydroxy acid oxidase [Desulfoferula mesophila]|uniref:Dehydrogenase, FMN-dependent n=1 Tax=Desulfoferula mesophila TaxID=3058419 RepID=A0AAU9EIC9_9BACT|nr:dehydrogenase, FMN-dependent [Desulfoferula mesophilus]